MGAVPTPPEPRRTVMNGRLQGFLTFLDLMAEGSRRQADLIAGGGFSPKPELRLVAAAAERKIPLIQHQISRLFEAPRKVRVSIEN
jgi:imidazolonepropionase-like amidohydrolase